jgi:predicted amidohydrolase YtcJ
MWLAACATAVAPEPAPTVDPAQSIIFHNGVILTMAPGQPEAEAIAIEGEKIAALGSDADILALRQAGSTVIDLDGRTLMPGFVDAHTHILNDARASGRSLDQAQYLALSNGITTLGDLYVDEPFLREMQAFDRRGELWVRTSLYLVANTNCGQAMGGWWKDHPPTRAPGEKLRIGGVKIFTDGGSCGGVALSFELEPGGGLGDLWLTQAELNRLVADAQAGGYQAAIHAIGDRAVRQAQEAVALALGGGPNTYRHRLEHVSVLPPDTLPRFGELGLIPVLNGRYPACTPFGPPLPAEYGAWEWPWRALREANPGLPIAWHSDHPFLTTNPFIHLFGFVTRTDVYQNYTCPAPEWLRDDTLTVEQALAVMTREAAYALFRETEVGSLEPGKYADVIVVSGNPLTTPADDLRRLSVLATLVGGRVEFCNPRNPELCPGYQARTPRPLPDLRPAVAIRWLMLALAGVLPLAAGLGLALARAKPVLARLGGAAGVVGGALWLWVFVWGMRSSETSGLVTWATAGAGTLLALASVGLAGVERPTRLGAMGLALAWLSLIVIAAGVILSDWFQQEEAWLMFFFGVLGHAVGLTVFGLANWLARRRQPRQWLPLAMGALGGLVPVVASMAANGAEWPLLLVGYGLGLGWVLLGLLTMAAGPQPR